MAEPRPPLCALLLQKSEPEHHEYRHMLASIDKYYTRLQAGMQDEAVRDQIVLNPAQALARLNKSFDTMRKEKKLSVQIAEEIFKSIVASLVNSPDNILSLQQSVQLVGSALPIIVEYPGTYLQLVADLLLAYEGLFEQLVADEDHSSTMKKWLLSKNTHLNLNILMAITQKLIDMCDACSCHGFKDLPETWNKATSLIVSLNDMIESQQQNGRNPKSKASLPSLETMKVLSQDDKKSNKVRREETKSFEIPHSVQESLQLLGCPHISSAGHLLHALEFVESESVPEIMRKALETFPCRVCLERLNGAVSSYTEPVSSSPQIVNSNPSVDIFGKRVGQWKVLLSDAAVKNAKKLARKGDFARVELKLRELASGTWKGKDLSYTAGSKKQKQKMRVPVLQARVNTVSLLWQIDVGYDHQDADPKNRQQIVRVWQLAASDDEVESAIDRILELQASYTAETVELCRQRPMQQSDGIWLPRRFGRVLNHSTQIRFAATVKADKALVDMSNKFYNVTEPFLKSIVETTGHEELPFDLSPEEMNIVRHFTTSSLILGRSGTGKTTCLLFKILAKYRARQAVPDEKPIRQLLLTRSPYLAAKLQAYAKSLIDTQARAVKLSESAEGSDQGLNSDSFFTMNDENFPFVCTYDEFLGLLEKTFRRADRQDFLRAKSNELQALDRPKVIGFNVFKTEYWGCLSGIAPSSCSPELLFAEIMGVVKGSGASASTLMPLTRAGYITKNPKVSPAFAAEAEREKVYQAFERYERLKKQRNQIDELDRVSALLELLKESCTLATRIRQCFEEIYVDEIQDLRCLDIVLLLSCVCDARGIHLAGDTAQCISKDSAFRFPEIKALFYEYYQVIAKELNQPSIARPMQFMLAKNYRSHQGILSFASWVMQLLWSGFPETIDKLDPEIGQTGGPKPIIFAGFDSSVLSAKMIGLVKLNDQVADFGAEQVILVRDEASKDKLQAEIGDIALVLTILESKGMEFDDVLIYDFFSGSGLGSSYRCLYLLAEARGAKFDCQKHAALCSELKHLYVAVTRARKQLWFMETAESSVEPVLQALSVAESTGLAEVVREKDHDVTEKIKVLRAGGTVDPERWLKRAAQFLQQKSFAEALFCFKKAEDPRGITETQAWLHEQEGRSRRAAGDVEGSRVCFEKAISLFSEIELLTEAAVCYQELGRYDKAGELWKSKGQLRKAAVLYEKDGHFRDASECFHAIGEFEQAIEVLRRGDVFDELISYMNRCRPQLSATTLRRYSRLCNILLKQGRISSELREPTINLLGSDREKVAFFKEFEMWDQLQSFYVARRRWYELYALFVSLGELPAALDTLFTHDLMPAMDKGVVESILHFSLAESLLAVWGLVEPSTELTEKHILETILSTPLEPTSKQWLSIFILFESFKEQEEERSLSLPGVSNMLRDFSCLLAVAYESELKVFNVSRMKNLPKEILIHAGSIIQGMEYLSASSMDDKAFQSLALLCGLWTPPSQPTEIVMLPWSPLKACYNAGPVDPSPGDLLECAKRWIRDRFATTLARFDDCSMRLMNQGFPWRCQNFIIRGTCPKNNSGDCNLLHERMESEVYQSKLLCVIGLAEVFSKLSSLYLQRVMGESFQGSFMKRRRRWLHALQNELIFVSSYEQGSASIAITIQRTLQIHPDYLAVISSLENLQYYRLKHEFPQFQHFTGLLEQLQIAQCLGPSIAARYSRALMGKLNFVIRRSKSPSHSQVITLKGLKAISNIHKAIAERDVQAFVQSAKDFNMCMGHIHPKELSRIHALLEFIELVSTYILRFTSPGGFIVLPRSWAARYLVQIHSIPTKNERTFSESDRFAFLDIINMTVFSLCKMVNDMEPEIAAHRLSFTGMGRTNLPAVIPKRRIFDCLTSIYLNLASYPNPPRGLALVWAKIQKAIALVAPPGFTLSTNFALFRESVVCQFDAYINKDRLHVISLNDSDDCPFYLRSFLGRGERPVKLSNILKPAGRKKATASILMTKDDHDLEDYSPHEVEIIIKMQRRWRRMMKIHEQRRKLMATTRGQLYLLLRAYCHAALTSAPAFVQVPLQEKVRLRKLVLIDGIDIMTDLEVILTSLKRLKEEWRLRIDNPLVTAEDIEELDSVHGKLGSIETKLNEVAETWSPNGLSTYFTTVSSKVLSKKARQAQRHILASQQDMDAIRGQLDAVGSR